MGYQESYFRMKKSTDFNKLVECIKNYGSDNFDGARPVEMITLLKPIKGDLTAQCHPEKTYSFKAGEKFIYVVGERYNQRNANNFFELCDDTDVLDYISKNIEIYFTETFPSYDIFENNSQTNMALHEEFPWEE